MSAFGRLLRHRRAGDAHIAWNQPHLQAADHLTVTSDDVADGQTLPLRHCARTIGGQDISPHLTWTPAPPGTAQLLLVVEDIDVPIAKPAVHCLALIDPATTHLESGALSAKRPGPGVRVLRSTIGRGYHGPAPIKSHGPHHYVFQLFALPAPVTANDARPRAVLATVTPPVLARGRLTATYER
jgi:phosphatidylethanolamine-binding protein (PEBP) family uncharacterized protein